MTPVKIPFYVQWRIRDPLYAVLFAVLALVPAGLLFYVLAQFCIALGYQHANGIAVTTEQLRVAVQQFQDSPFAFDFLLCLQQVLMVSMLYLCVFKRFGCSVKPFFTVSSTAKDVQRSIKLFAAAVFINTCVVMSVGYLVMFFAELNAKDSVQAVAHYREGLDAEAQIVLSSGMGWLRIILVVLVGPVVEELLYRGCLYGALRKKYSPFWANAISSSCFALSHFPVALGLPNILVIGVLGGWAYERTRSLRVCILFHMLWNLFGTVAARPALWPVLLSIVYVLWIWAYRRLGQGNQTPSHSHLGWKAYAIAFTGVTCVEWWTGDRLWWSFLLYIPWMVGLLSVVWKRPLGNRHFWLVYGVLCLGVTLMEWWALWTPLSIRVPWQMALAGQEYVGGDFPEGVRVMLISWAWLFPGFLVLWRLARGAIELENLTD